MPTAHDEPAIHLDIYKEMFSLPAAVAYNTEVERRFLTTHFPIRAVAEETVGCGVDLPASDARESRRSTPRSGTRDDEPDTEVRRFDGYQPLPHTSPSAARCSGAGTGCTGRSCCTAGASIRARAARS